MNDALPAAVLTAPRILVIDDNRAIHDDFRKIFGASRRRAAPSAAERALLGGSDSAGAVEFRVDFAQQGEEGLALVRLAQEQGQPYAMAFVDVRMPPGWDGVETTARICQHDADIQIVICTAYSDYSWSEMLAKLGRSDRLVILKKPFDTIEVLQLASALSEKWRLARESRTLLEDLESRVAERTRELAQSVDELRRSESVKGAILESSLDCLITIDHDGKIVEFNPAAEATFGLRREQVLGKEMAELIVPPSLREAHRRGIAHYLATGIGPILGKRLELAAMRADGSEFPIELAIIALRGTAEPMFTGFLRDITARKEADERIRRLNRVYAVLSGINTLIVRARTRDELFREACSIAIEAGGFRMAWVGLLDAAGGAVKPMASAGDVRDFFDSAPLAVLEDKPGGHGLAGRAIRARAPMVSQDVQNDPQLLMKPELAERGINSVAMIPLIVDAEAIGVLALYAAGSGGFDEDEMRLLVELAGDIAFAIEHIEKAEKLARLTRVNAMLSGINAAIVRIRGRQELFEEACRIAVETGGLSFAWFGMVDEVAMRLRPVASAGGGEGFLDMIRDRLSLRDDALAGHGLAARAVREKRATVLHDVDVDPYLPYQARYAHLGVKAVAALPLTVAGRSIGAFGLLASEAGFFDGVEMKLLGEVVANIEFALEHIEKEEKVRRLTRVYAVLSGINALIVRARDRDELFKEVCRIAVGVGGFKAAWLGLADPSATRLDLMASEGVAPEYLAQMPLGLSESDGKLGLAGRAVSEKSPVIVDDMEHDPRILLRREAGERGFHSLVMLPLVVSDAVVGVLALYAGEIGFFNADEMKLLLGLAGDIAFALEHIEKEEKLQRLTRVRAVLSDMNALIVRVKSSRELFEGACRIAVEQGKFAMAWAGSFDAATEDVTPVAWAGEQAELLTTAKSSARADTPRGAGAVGRAIRERRPVFNNDITASHFGGPRLQEILRLGFQSQITLPLYEEQAITATLTMYTREANFFDAEEVRLLTEMAGDISFALRNISREEKLAKLARIRAVSSETNAAIVRIRERKALLEETCRIVSEHGKFEMIWIGAIDEAAQQVEPIAWKGFSKAAAGAISWAGIARAKGALGEALRTRQASVRNDIEGELPAGGLRAEALKVGCGSSLCLPLMVEGRVVALVLLFAAGAGFFDDEELALLVGLAGNISFAIEHLEREEKVERLTRVYAVLSGINALIVRVKDRAALFEGACRIAVEAGRFRTAWIGMAKENRIEPTASAATHPQHLAFLKDRFWALGEPPANSLVDRAVREKKAIFSNDAQNDPRVQLREEHAARGTHSIAILPLLLADEAVGVLALYAEEADFFDAAELTLLTELAGDIAFALENLERQQKLEKLARIRAVSSQINAAIVRVQDPEGLLREICRIAVEHGKFELTWTALIDQEKKRIQPVSWAGFSDEVANNLKWANLSNPLVTMAQAIRTREVAVSNDISAGAAVGSLRLEAVKLGHRSTACVPFLVDDGVVAAMILFAREPGFFDAEELALLNEMAADVSFALQAMEARKKVEYLSYYDALTGLANRSLFLERLAQHKRAATGAGHKLALFLLDLERFKNINDSLGRPAGDALLRQVAEWLTRSVGDANLVARMGADIFAVVLPEVKQGGNVAGLLEKTTAAFMEHPFRLGAAVFRVALKVGVAIFPDDGADADTLFRNAEAALKKAKSRGERYLFYKAQMTDSVAGKLTLENQLRRALDNEEFVLHYQPKVSLANSKLTGAEALIRWNDPQTGLVPPGRFIPVLEETGLIYDVGRWALRKAIAEHLRWLDAGLAAVRIAVNVSPLQLRNRGFIAEVEQALGIDARAANGLELEITESLIMEDLKHNIACLQAIRDMGVRIAIDDFGTGFSSLSYLSKLPVHSLKIDRSFVIDMTTGPDGLSLVSTIIQLAHSLKLKVVAEGVETEEQSRLLRLLSCDEMQGYLFSKPVPGEEFEARFLAAPASVAA